MTTDERFGAYVITVRASRGGTAMRAAMRRLPTGLRSAAGVSRSVIWRTIVRAWDDSIFGRSAQAAFWQTLSLPPLLLGLLGSVGYIAGWFGPDTIGLIRSRILGLADKTFTPQVVSEIINPMIDNVLSRGHAELISVGFVLSLWAGSSAVASFVDAIVHAHDQHAVRHPVWHRIFALELYVGFLVSAVFVLPLVAIGPTYVRKLTPESWQPYSSSAVAYGYFPAVTTVMILALTTLYRVALPRPLPWHRLIGGAALASAVFWCAAAGLRFYLTNIISASYSYGVLATPIAFLLFTFSLGFAVITGAHFNAVIQTTWPAKGTHVHRLRRWTRARAQSFFIRS